ncbi:MAG: hypothetical protein ACYCX3_14745, partial [Thermoleophilia bacterium]
DGGGRPGGWRRRPVGRGWSLGRSWGQPYTGGAQAANGERPWWPNLRNERELADFDLYKAAVKRAARIDDGTYHAIYSELPAFPPQV